MVEQLLDQFVSAHSLGQSSSLARFSLPKFERPSEPDRPRVDRGNSSSDGLVNPLTRRLSLLTGIIAGAWEEAYKEHQRTDLSRLMLSDRENLRYHSEKLEGYVTGMFNRSIAVFLESPEGIELARKFYDGKLDRIQHSIGGGGIEQIVGRGLETANSITVKPIRHIPAIYALNSFGEEISKSEFIEVFRGYRTFVTKMAAVPLVFLGRFKDLMEIAHSDTEHPRHEVSYPFDLERRSDGKYNLWVSCSLLTRAHENYLKSLVGLANARSTDNTPIGQLPRPQEALAFQCPALHARTSRGSNVCAELFAMVENLLEETIPDSQVFSDRALF